MKFSKIIFLISVLFLFTSCINSNLRYALDAEKSGDTNNAIKHFDKYLNENSNGKIIKTSNKKINALQAKSLAHKIDMTLENQEDSLSADDLRKLLKKIKNYSFLDPDDIIFSLTRSRINERLDIIKNECQSLENILNIFLENKENFKAYKTFNFIKEKDNKYLVAPLTEIKIIDIYVKNNEKNFFKNLNNNDFETASEFVQSIDEQYFNENHKNELKEKYSKILNKKALPIINNYIKEKKFLNAYYINNTTLKDEKITKKIKKELKDSLINEDGKIDVQNFLTLEGYLIINPKLKPLVEKEYYEYIDNITLPTTNLSFILKNFKLKKDLYLDLKSTLKDAILEMTIPVKIKNSNSKDVDYAIELETYKLEEDTLKAKVNISRLRPKYENIIIQNVSSPYDKELENNSINKLTKKIMRVVRQNVKVDALTMLKSARYYLTKNDFKNFKNITNKLILLNQIDPFCEDLKLKLINLLSEYEVK